MVDKILDMHYFRDLIPELQRRQLKLGLFYETKANLTKQQVGALHDAGIESIQQGSKASAPISCAVCVGSLSSHPNTSLFGSSQRSTLSHIHSESPVASFLISNLT